MTGMVVSIILIVSIHEIHHMKHTIYIIIHPRFRPETFSVGKYQTCLVS
jgi:hypothetical protein